MILIKWLKSRIRKKRCKYSLYFLGREGNTRETQPKNQGTAGAIAHPSIYEEVGERRNINMHTTPNVSPNTSPNPKTKIRQICTSPKALQKLITPIVKEDCCVDAKTYPNPKVDCWIIKETKGKTPKSMTLSLKKPNMYDTMTSTPKNPYIPCNSNFQIYGHANIRECADEIISELENVMDNLKKAIKDKVFKETILKDE